MKLLRICRNKKGASFDIPGVFSIFLYLFLLIWLLYFAFTAPKSLLTEAVDTGGIEHRIRSERILSSFSYEEAGRNFRDIVDESKVTQRVVNDTIVIDSKKRLSTPVFKVDLVYRGGKKTIYTDKELYDDVLPLVGLKYIKQTNHKYVLVKTKEGLKEGELDITGFVPKN